MAKPLDALKASGAKMETPFTILQVESHLIFGPISRYVPFAYVVLVAGVLSFIVGSLATSLPVGQYVGQMFDKLIFLVTPLIMIFWTYRQQAILGWIAVKGALGLAAFAMATIGAGVSFQHGHADAWPNLFLGLIWIPGIEFIPKVTPHQRYVTLARMVLSVPCIYVGIKSGNWH